MCVRFLELLACVIGSNVELDKHRIVSKPIENLLYEDFLYIIYF